MLWLQACAAILSCPQLFICKAKAVTDSFPSTSTYQSLTKAKEDERSLTLTLREPLSPVEGTLSQKYLSQLCFLMTILVTYLFDKTLSCL